MKCDEELEVLFSYYHTLLQHHRILLLHRNFTEIFLTKNYLILLFPSIIYSVLDPIKSG